MKISCKKAKEICDKAQYKEATRIDILKLQGHKLLCKACFIHTKKNSELTKLCGKAALVALSDKEKEEMKQALLKTKT